MKSSGSNLFVALSEDSLDVNEAIGRLRADAAGGHCLFVGTTRDNADGKKVTTLFYEAYDEMAIRQMRALGEQAMAKWPIERCVVIHRLGEVPVGASSIVIGVSSAHRAEAFDACRFLIDKIKAQVPIWKREQFEDGTRAWVQGTVPPAE